MEIYENAMQVGTSQRPDDGALFEFLDDLEARAAAAARRERAEQVQDRARSAYGQVSLESRLMASVGRFLNCLVSGVGRIQGRLVRVGSGWMALEVGVDLWYLRTPAVGTVKGASARAVPEQAWSRADQLGFGSALRRLGDEGVTCMVHLADQSTLEGVLGRVGADFVELTPCRTRDFQVEALPEGAELVRVSEIVGIRASGLPPVPW